MSHLDIIRAWKDETYRESLGEAERALLPDNPAGFIELTDASLSAIVGGLQFGGLQLGNQTYTVDIDVCCVNSKDFCDTNASVVCWCFEQPGEFKMN